MCGIAGIVVGKKYSNKELKNVRDLFTQILIAHEERGREATGVAVIYKDSNYFIHKSPVPSSEFIKTKDYGNFLKSITKKTSIILGHTRKPTKGTQWNPQNNHPIKSGDIIGVHNGSIKNDDFLFNYEGFERNGEVDSEVIFSLIDRVENSEELDYSEKIKKVVNKLSGSFATLSVNLKTPGKILVLKYNQPLSYHYSKSLQTLFFVSRYIFLRKAFGRSVVAEALPSQTGYLFDLSTKSAKNGLPEDQFPLVSKDDFFSTNSKSADLIGI